MKKVEQLNINNFEWTDVLLIQMKDNRFREVIVIDIDDDMFSFDLDTTGNTGDVTLQDIHTGEIFGANHVKDFWNDDVNVAFMIRNTFLNRMHDTVRV